RLWARLFSAFGDGAVERPIGGGGYALFEDVSLGTYVLVVYDGEQVRALRTVEAKDMRGKVRVELTSCGIGHVLDDK
ncbi:MAG TPA: hypothetical protein VGL53_29210, partial [Bryobacteraceae bacterium]